MSASPQLYSCTRSSTIISGAGPAASQPVVGRPRRWPQLAEMIGGRQSPAEPASAYNSNAQASAVLSVAIAILIAPALGLGTGGAACSTAPDCSLGGLCVHGRCQCDTAFRGDKCSELNLRPAPTEPLLDIGNQTASWGGFPVYDEADKLWHLFYAE